jgi:tRNA modification GTPase
MYNVHDTIAAVSSAAGTDGARTIVRVSGAKAFEILGNNFSTATQEGGSRTAPTVCVKRPQRGVICGSIRVDDELVVDAIAYLFSSPHSYTGDDLVELHIFAPMAVIEAVMQRVFACGARAAGPGEFTARAYLAGKIDLAQAEAVAQIVAGGNVLQLAAAQKLLAGRLTKTIQDIQQRLLDLISRIEAGLDFAGEDIEFISSDEAIGHIDAAVAVLQQLLSGSVSCEEVIHLPAVGIVGAPNAGKSSLLNALLGQQRSIVSGTRATTRDVLTGVLKLPHCNCAIFDCAGLLPPTISKTILDQLAQDAAIDAMHTAQVVVFCVDVSKPAWDEDIQIFEMVRHKNLIATATKCNVPASAILVDKLRCLETVFGRTFLVSSSAVANGIESLKVAIDAALTAGSAAQTADMVSLNQRHRRWLEEAISNLGQAKEELVSDNGEVAVMLLRNGYRAFGELSDEGIDEAVLDRIFSRFCIGK